MPAETSGENNRPTESELEELLSAAEMLRSWTRGRSQTETKEADSKPEQSPEE